MKKVLKIVLSLLLVVVVFVVGMLIFLTVTDYKPNKEISLDIRKANEKLLNIGEELSVMTWNIGYCGLGKEEDFFLDGGKKVKPDNKEVVDKNIDGIVNSLKNFNNDFYLFQEIDVDADRSFNINQLKLFEDFFKNLNSTFGYNYKVSYVPLPIPPTGKVNAGQGTFSEYKIEKAKRYAFDGNYKWPLNTIMLDRCFISTEIPIEGKDSKLILVNAHFSAYDDGTLRTEQLEAVKGFILSEYQKGNYIIFGGDWNQSFEIVDTSKFPMFGDGSFYTPYPIPNQWLEKDWKWGVSDNAATYRLLNEAYKEGESQTGVIDGFVVSPNIKIIDTEVIDLGFNNSDHNPVKMKFILN